jgi:hypothetical protein
MDIPVDKVCELILRMREIDMKDGETDPDSGSNPIDDGSTDVLTTSDGDSVEDQVREFIAGLNDDEHYDLVALTGIALDRRLPHRHSQSGGSSRRGPRGDRAKLHLAQGTCVNVAAADRAAARGHDITAWPVSCLEAGEC